MVHVSSTSSYHEYLWIFKNCSFVGILVCSQQYQLLLTDKGCLTLLVDLGYTGEAEERSRAIPQTKSPTVLRLASIASSAEALSRVQEFAIYTFSYFSLLFFEPRNYSWYKCIDAITFSDNRRTGSRTSDQTSERSNPLSLEPLTVRIPQRRH
jgi:hypothetical protein